jgi:hypothetical protein
MCACVRERGSVCVRVCVSVVRCALCDKRGTDFICFIIIRCMGMCVACPWGLQLDADRRHLSDKNEPSFISTAPAWTCLAACHAHTPPPHTGPGDPKIRHISQQHTHDVDVGYSQSVSVLGHAPPKALPRIPPPAALRWVSASKASAERCVCTFGHPAKKCNIQSSHSGATSAWAKPRYKSSLLGQADCWSV